VPGSPEAANVDSAGAATATASQEAELLAADAAIDLSNDSADLAADVTTGFSSAAV
jgi:hypothetical protein